MMNLIVKDEIKIVDSLTGIPHEEDELLLK